MKLPRDLSGAELAKVLCKHYGYVRLHKEGSHIILQTERPAHHRISVPDHSPLRLGTLNAILNAVRRVQGVTKDDILQKL
ncbi:MAG: type II toxin-antitoxin system HicA family toxin [Verrucomicrobia bacterium]|nr:type II toxin-antitoxin system HicA family toxin [Verrucomicrobiota bacterium]